jgi:hypothetical protein
VPGTESDLREFANWLAKSWPKLMIALVLAPVVGAGIAVFCLAVGVHAVVRSRSSAVARRISPGETLNALIAAVLPAVVYGCWGEPADVPGQADAPPVSSVAVLISDHA